jgi:hypothetical protein
MGHAALLGTSKGRGLRMWKHSRKEIQTRRDTGNTASQ